MHPQDFEEIERVVIKRFEDSLNSADPVFAVTIAKISARVATMAIQEYHRKLQHELDQQHD